MAGMDKAGPEEGSPLRASLGQVLRTLGDLIVLNWLCVLCALPVVTAGPALCALYYVTLKLVRGEEVPALRGFLDAFRANFKRGAALGLMVLTLGALAAGDALFALRQEGALRVLFLTVATIMAVIALTLLCYVFPLQARFQNTWKGQVKNAFALAFCSPGRTLLLWLIALLPAAVPLVLPLVVTRTLGFVYFIAGASGPVWLASRVLLGLFRRVGALPAEEEKSKG